jgi:hypothetical protein
LANNRMDFNFSLYRLVSSAANQEKGQGKCMRKLFVAIFICLFAVNAYAGFLQIVGDPDLKIIVRKGKVKITGTLELENRGAEISPEVAAIIKIGQWSWAGTPVKLEQKAKNLWNISDEVELKKLSCPAGSLCGDLPLIGRFPVFLQRIYRDVNLYSFSSPSLLLVDIGEITPGQRDLLTNAKIMGKMELKGNGTVFQGELDLRNIGQKDADVFVDMFTSRELQVNTKARVIRIPAESSQRIDVKIESFSGIAGSTYPVFAYFQWNDEGIRNCNTAFTAVSIEKPKEIKLYMIPGLIGLAVVGGITLWKFIRRRKTAGRI